MITTTEIEMLLIQVKALEMMPIMTKLMRITSHCMVPLHGCPNSKKKHQDRIVSNKSDIKEIDTSKNNSDKIILIT